ncbi:hypothetical protein [Actinoplanes xinjiangensis]|uniref:Uncharacterized protein n=1 Tax=Actinoplanes xinjiangensis TaxID=512350 RepID=A0A316FEB4_9ACTN|nr:hypothetical protein [Actinoplanes xinjiangensis]PWK35841.1 hypothetical protein BC793_12542 [Actinoplanes xinjiangensis]GIF43024.1 hypothetical protein Axi01nite_73350 [Actinoplanes xinjiangensis]
MTQSAAWQWNRQSPAYGNFGNANQWTVNAGLVSLARESAQNTNDARAGSEAAELVYSFIRLTGAARDAFLATLGWSDLKAHLQAMGEAARGAVTAGQIRAGLEASEQTDSLVLLRIADYGCRGLTGPEFAEDGLSPDDFGNFIKLCRLDLFSGKDKAAGGSFGLGKAVYWRFSRLQTVLFNSVLAPSDAVDGFTQNRVFGVNQGVLHQYRDMGYEGRGYFGRAYPNGHVGSVWNDFELVDALHLNRADARPGTTALLLGFYDPDQPQRGLNGPEELTELAHDLREGVEENFWPLLTRGGLRVRIEVIDNDTVLSEKAVDPEETYTELVRALRRFDAGKIDDELSGPDTVVVRDVPVTVPRRRTGDRHQSFVHQAKLVVTLSDDQKDTLENRVCLLRRPEMIVQTLDRPFDGHTYHAFLLAGAAIHPAAPTAEQLWADDFLRFAEPPAHDRWLPGIGRRQASQANLTAHYLAPWVPNLQGIEKGVAAALHGLFGAPPARTGAPPESLLRHLRFLRSESGSGGAGGAPHKPEVDLTEWRVEDGRWNVRFTVRAKNRPQGWHLRPVLAFVGLDGRRAVVDWDSLLVEDGAGRLVDGGLRIEATPRGRFAKVTLHGRSTGDLPIPAEEAAVEVILQKPGPLLTPNDEDA